jgi:hypothetical protein
MEPRVSFILTMFVVYLIATIALIVIAAKSPLTKDRKIVVYITSIISPFIGLIVYLIVKNGRSNATA